MDLQLDGWDDGWENSFLWWIKGRGRLGYS